MEDCSGNTMMGNYSGSSSSSSQNNSRSRHCSDRMMSDGDDSITPTRTPTTTTASPTATTTFSNDSSSSSSSSLMLLESTDIIREVATFLVDDAQTLCRLSCVSKSCHSAILDSPQVWKATCRRRWSRKWGFHRRWQAALLEERQARREQQLNAFHQQAALPKPGAFLSIIPPTPATALGGGGRWWRDKYQWQERDAQRASITSAELHSMTFDFRFWVSQFWGHGNLLASGLKWPASQEFRFAPPQEEELPPPVAAGAEAEAAADGTTCTTTSASAGAAAAVAVPATNPTPPPSPPSSSPPDFSWPGMERGRLLGHPSGREDLEWFLDHDGKSMQWGKLPTLWPRGTVHRLDTWGWELRNPNVCLRAMDSIPVAVDPRTRTIRWECIKDTETGNFALWSDYLARLRRFPTDFGMPQEGIAFLEAPEEFWEFLENRQRFPRLGIDEQQIMTTTDVVVEEPSSLMEE